MIYKYFLDDIIRVPRDSKPLYAAVQNGIPRVWIQLGESTEMSKLEFQMVGTGWGSDTSNLQYLNTFQEGSLVWHVFFSC